MANTSEGPGLSPQHADLPLPTQSMVADAFQELQQDLERLNAAGRDQRERIRKTGRQIKKLPNIPSSADGDSLAELLGELQKRQEEEFDRLSEMDTALTTTEKRFAAAYARVESTPGQNAAHDDAVTNLYMAMREHRNTKREEVRQLTCCAAAIDRVLQRKVAILKQLGLVKEKFKWAALILPFLWFLVLAVAAVLTVTPPYVPETPPVTWPAQYEGLLALSWQTLCRPETLAHASTEWPFDVAISNMMSELNSVGPQVDATVRRMRSAQETKQCRPPHIEIFMEALAAQRLLFPELEQIRSLTDRLLASRRRVKTAVQEACRAGPGDMGLEEASESLLELANAAEAFELRVVYQDTLTELYGDSALLASAVAPYVQERLARCRASWAGCFWVDFLLHWFEDDIGIVFGRVSHRWEGPEHPFELELGTLQAFASVMDPVLDPLHYMQKLVG